MKKVLLVAAVIAFCSMFQNSASAEPTGGTAAKTKTITIEPEQCVTRCFFIMGVPVYCYEMCF
ncbi:MAG TPA: hypothetical protein VFQ61_19945 [Polyangiaceae bacterium]|nr:hypothetical protein [Polyangiaceae bacterium]